MIIAFDGADCTGKSTIAKALNERINASGKQCITWSFPSKSRFGRNILKLYSDKCEQLLSSETIRTLLWADYLETVIRVEECLKREPETIHIFDRWTPFTDYFYSGALKKDNKGKVFGTSMVQFLMNLHHCMPEVHSHITPDRLYIVSSSKEILLKRLALKKNKDSIEADSERILKIDAFYRAYALDTFAISDKFNKIPIELIINDNQPVSEIVGPIEQEIITELLT